MKSFCVLSSRKQAGKTHVASISIASLLSVGRSVAYYKPVVLNAVGGRLCDIDYIKRTTHLPAKDIYTSFACSGNTSPLHSTDKFIDILDIIELIEEIAYNYDVMLFEALGLYDPIKEDYTFTDLIFDMPSSVEMSAILTIPYDENVISHTLGQIENLHTRGIKTSLVLINQITDIEFDSKIIKYIKKQIEPIKLLIVPFDNRAGLVRIEEPEIKYGDILDAILLA